MPTVGGKRGEAGGDPQTPGKGLRPLHPYFEMNAHLRWEEGRGQG